MKDRIVNRKFPTKNVNGVEYHYEPDYIMTATGVDLITAFSAVTACLNNLGPGLGDVAENYASLTNAGKWILCGAMLMGRLELYTLLVLISPAFWRN